jgi:hypothetical protein
MCCIRPKNSRFDFCGLACLLDARKLAPLLLAIPRDHVTFTMGTFVQAAFSRAITTVYSSQEQVPTSLESWLVPQHQKCVQSCGKLCLNRCIFCISVRFSHKSGTCFELIVRVRHKYGNEQFRFHGTNRRCRLGDDGHTTLCTSSLCSACSIIKTSFKVSLANPGGA